MARMGAVMRTMRRWSKESWFAGDHVNCCPFRRGTAEPQGPIFLSNQHGRGDPGAVGGLYDACSCRLADLGLRFLPFSQGQLSRSLSDGGTSLNVVL
ncbi:hypothetical protein AAFF_G00287350 [Aldrovandia affinis]|uniref:Uncharacterized protein n=1 Tax=Aldrovandia affinis TaxID=143900 RepID=A0AAD7SQN0_9TELE|nr:hypothetical protein AAFF_G00287350 [Aldrovandia affinis]